MKYVTRDKIIKEASFNLLKELYMRAQPPVNIEEYIEKYKTGEFTKKDRCYEWHYLPAEVETQIIEDYLEAYGANDQFKKWTDFLLDNFKNGGHRTAYKDIFGTGELDRTSEETETLPELIGEENAEKVYKLIEDFRYFYRTNMDEHSIRCVVFQGPTSNPETVKEKWGSNFKIDESFYKNYDGQWDYTYKDFYNGHISEDSWYMADLEEGTIEIED